MAPADTLAPAGSSSYSSDTMSVGDGTWDFTKNTFLLPNLMGLNFETMRYNGMGNRFSTVHQYHTLILGHAILGAITFLFIVPFGIMTVRFYTRRAGYALRYHAYLQILTVLLSTVILVLGWFAVGPKRSLSNPHHGIGVAIYVLVLLQAIGGRFVRHLAGQHSIRLKLHNWLGHGLCILGIVQVPLGLTLYGSPKYLFILYALWMTFLLVLYFILSHRHEGRLREGGGDVFVGGGQSEASRPQKSGGMLRWLGPLAAGAGAIALLRNRNKEDKSRRNSSYSRTDITSSRRDSDSFVEDEKYNNRRRASGGTGFMGKILTAGAGAGAGALLANMVSGRRTNARDEEYSAVDTDTPSRYSRFRRDSSNRRNNVPESEASYFTEDMSRTETTASPTPAPRRHGTGTAVAAGATAGVAAAALSGRHRDRRDSRDDRSERPVTPRPSHRRTESVQDSIDASDYSSYQSPSRRTTPSRRGAAGKGLLAGMGLGWFANKMAGRKTEDSTERYRREEDERRSGTHGSRYTGDGHGRMQSAAVRMNQPPRLNSMSEFSDSVIEAPTGGRSTHSGPPMPPFGPPVPSHGMAQSTTGVSTTTYTQSAAAPVTPANPRRSRSRHDVERVTMPSIPADSDSDSVPSRIQGTSRHGRSGDIYTPGAAAAGAAAGAAAIGRGSRHSVDYDRRSENYQQTSGGKPVSVKLKVHDDRDRNITLRRLTEEEAAAERRRERRARNNDSASSISGVEGRRYRRDSTVRPAELSAERRAEGSHYGTPPTASSTHQPLDPPNPPFAGGRRPKDSAYYSGAQAGPSGTNPAAGGTMSSIDSPGSHGTWSAMSPSPQGAAGTSQAPELSSNAAAERRRRRRMERSDTARQTRVDYQ